MAGGRKTRGRSRRSSQQGRMGRPVEMRGRFAIVADAVTEAERLLPSFRDASEDHEGIVFLLGHEGGEMTVFTTVLAPCADHGPGHVMCPPEEIAAAVRRAREHRVVLLGQLHSHPGSWIEHSEGDDHLVLMPFEGMLSLVCAHYGRVGLRPLTSLGVHQYQDGRWRLIKQTSVAENFTILPSGIDLR